MESYPIEAPADKRHPAGFAPASRPIADRDEDAISKGDPRKVICAALVKGLTSVKNDWLARRLRMGHPAAMSQLVNRARRDPKNLKILRKHERIFKSKD